MSSPPDIVFLGCPVLLLVRTQYLTNGLVSFDSTDREYLLASTDNLVRFWRSQSGGEGRHPCWHWGSNSIFWIII